MSFSFNFLVPFFKNALNRKTTFRSVFANNSVFNLHFMKVSTENDNNFGYEYDFGSTQSIEKRRKKHARLTYQAKSLPLQREFGRVALHSVHSNGPTDPYIYMYPFSYFMNL
jgi:hypothetical protein